MYKTLTVENRSFIKRFSHQTRFNIAANLLDLKTNDSFLDYGTGDGQLLFIVKNKYQTIKRVVGYEPTHSQFEQLKNFAERSLGSEVEIANTPPSGSKFTKISCLEVLEHMTIANQLRLLNEIRLLMENDGLFVLSIPIEIGFSGFLKNIVRILLRQTHPNTTFINLFKAAFSFRINRPDEPYIHSHIGFNHKELQRLFPIAGFKVEKCVYSPLPYLGRVLNAQIFYLLRKI